MGNCIPNFCPQASSFPSSPSPRSPPFINRRSSKPKPQARPSSSTPQTTPPLLKKSTSIIGLDKLTNNHRKQLHLFENVVHIEFSSSLKSIDDVYSNVHTGLIIGSGISGVVRECIHKITGVVYAVKALDLSKVHTASALRQLRAEITTLVSLDHPNIVRLEEVYESPNSLYLVFERLHGGELFDRLDEQKDYHYSEATCSSLVSQMLSAVRYAHTKGIIHRDLKLENFLFTSERGNVLKLIDFGLSKHFVMGDVQDEPVGTPYTVAPEVLKGSYDEKCDIWAIGVITFLLLSGFTPFGGCAGEPLTTVRLRILSGRVTFDENRVWTSVSAEAKRFIKALLVLDPKDRPTAAEAQKNQWFVVHEGEGNGSGMLSPGVVSSLIKFKSYDNFHKLICEILSFTLLSDQIGDLSQEFELADVEKTGEITLSCLRSILARSASDAKLGALTEDEILEVFNSIKTSNDADTDQNIHYHEFIAACLSLCAFDDRNLRLAFDRLDSERKGFICMEDVLEMMGTDATDESVRQMFWEAHKKCTCSAFAQISFTDFRLLMKGQESHVTHDEAAFVELDKAETKFFIGTSDGDGDDSGDGFGEGKASDDLDDVWDRYEDQYDLPHTTSPSSTTPTSPQILLRQEGSLQFEQFEVPPSSSPSPTSSATKAKTRTSPPPPCRHRSRSLNAPMHLTTEEIQTKHGPPHYHYLKVPLAPILRESRMYASSSSHSSSSDVNDVDSGGRPLKEGRAMYRAQREFRLQVGQAARLFDKKRRERREKVRRDKDKDKDNGVEGKGKANLILQRSGESSSSLSNWLPFAEDKEEGEEDKGNEKNNEEGNAFKSSATTPPPSVKLSFENDAYSDSPLSPRAKGENRSLRMMSDLSGMM